MQVKSIAECSKGSILQYLTFIKLPFAIKTFVLSILSSRLTGFTVQTSFLNVDWYWFS